MLKPEAVYRIARINPAERDFPGGRATDQLVLYTPAYGARTGTNSFGVEAVVRGGVVQSCEGNDSEIPPDGFVLSGHGEAAAWLTRHLQPGTGVTVENGEVRARFTVESAEHLTRLAADEAARAVAAAAPENAARAQPLLETARKRLAEARTTAQGGQTSAAIEAFDEATRFAREAFYAAQSSLASEGRGVWFRLTAAGPDDARALVERCAAKNINMLFPETLYWNTSLTPQLGPGLPPQNDAYRGWDPLAVLIEAAHARGMEVHAWCEIFFVGPGEPALARMHPDWLAVDRDGTTRCRHEENFRFFCPSRPEPREYLWNLLSALVAKYPLDGLQFDYIRYPTSPPMQGDFCFCTHCREVFQQEAGRDPISINPATEPDAWAQWTLWRQRQVSTFVEEAARRLRAARPGLLLSAAVFPEVAHEARAERCQDWPTWAEKRWVDFLCPMIYRSDTAEVARLVAEDVSHAAGVPVYAGLAPFMELTPEQLVRQIAAARREGAMGQVLFAEDHLDGALGHALTVGPWRSPAQLPHSRRRNSSPLDGR